MEDAIRNYSDRETVFKKFTSDVQIKALIRYMKHKLEDEMRFKTEGLAAINDEEINLLKNNDHAVG